VQLQRNLQIKRKSLQKNFRFKKKICLPWNLWNSNYSQRLRKFLKNLYRISIYNLLGNLKLDNLHLLLLIIKKYLKLKRILKNLSRKLFILTLVKRNKRSIWSRRWHQVHLQLFLMKKKRKLKWMKKIFPQLLQALYFNSATLRLPVINLLRTIIYLEFLKRK